MFAFLSAHQIVSRKPLTGVPAKDAPGLEPTALHAVKDASLQLSRQARTCWNHTAMSAKIPT